MALMHMASTHPSTSDQVMLCATVVLIGLRSIGEFMMFDATWARLLMTDVRNACCAWGGSQALLQTSL
jgi:hypothetical protein